MNHSDESTDDSDYEEEEEEGMTEYELGFVVPLGLTRDYEKEEEHQEPVETRRLLLHQSSNWSRWDGGKVGGKPVWLNPVSLPTEAQMSCQACAARLSFLCQIYSPIDSEEETEEAEETWDAFHRSLYLFCCRNASCAKQGDGRVFRCQLPRRNRFYPFEIPTTATPTPMPQETKRCALCHQRATFTCSRCQGVHYCCAEHQKDHWMHVHKHQCNKENVDITEYKKKAQDKGTIYLFPEYVIDIEHEPRSSDAIDENEAKIIEDFKKSAKLNASDDDDPFSNDSKIDIKQSEISDLLQSVNSNPDEEKHKKKKIVDPTYLRFLTRIEMCKSQILRYSIGPKDPLWLHSDHTKKHDEVPKCSNCGASRIFEFQIMPQLVSFLKLDEDDNFDFGILAVYTCAEYCAAPVDESDPNGRSAYLEEFMYRQPPFAKEE